MDYFVEAQTFFPTHFRGSTEKRVVYDQTPVKSFARISEPTFRQEQLTYGMNIRTLQLSNIIYNKDQFGKIKRGNCRVVFGDFVHNVLIADPFPLNTLFARLLVYENVAYDAQEFLTFVANVDEIVANDLILGAFQA